MSGPAAPALPFDRAAAFEDLQQRLFAPSGEDLVGLEAELILLDARQRRPVPVFRSDAPSVQSSLEIVRQAADAQGWSESESPYGSPRFRTPSGGTLSFEPGGQLEWSSTPSPSLPTVLDEAEDAFDALAARARAAGVEMVARGIDPVNRLEDSPLHLNSRRYARMADHLERWHPYGATMMRQCAALHVNLDFGTTPERRWQGATALTPLLTAIFANSSLYAGAITGHRSYRAYQWRHFDPLRSGLLPGTDAPRALFRRALAADDFLARPRPGEPTSAAERLDAGLMTLAAWKTHLSTFFPEVRPRGYLELRAVDALPPRWYAAPLVFLTGLLYDETALSWALAELPEPSEDALRRAGRSGLRDPALAALARRAFREALAGAERLGVGFTGSGPLDVAHRFFERFTLRGEDPGDEPAE